MNKLNFTKGIVNIHKGVYTEIDAILDTRYAVLSRYFPDIAKKIETNKTGLEYYHSRPIDEFFNLPYEVFNLFYKRRNREVLKNAKINAVIHFLNLTLADLLNKRINSEQGNSIVNLVVNTYPYLLNKSEINLMENAIKLKLTYPTMVNVKFSYIPYHKLTSRYIDENFGLMVMYNYIEWYNIRGYLKDITPNIPHVKLITPALIDKALVFKDNKTYEDYFKSMEKATMTYINLEFSGIEIFNSLHLVQLKDQMLKDEK